MIQITAVSKNYHTNFFTTLSHTKIKIIPQKMSKNNNIQMRHVEAGIRYQTI